ncbi:Imm49 family immunity protein [Pyxidicoccus sp. 3LG]
MGIKALSLANETLSGMIDVCVDALRRGPVHSKHVLDVSRSYRRLGCGMLLASHGATRFFFCLHLAADAWLQYLERKHLWPDADVYYLARARAEPILDAVALGNTELVRNLDERMEPQWHEGMEYEEDYCYFTLLPRLLSPATPHEELFALLDRMEGALEGASHPRCDALKALLQGDSKRFDEALRALIDAWNADAERERRGGQGNAFALATEAQVFIEGIALVRVARARGLSTRALYPLIPTPALGEPQAGMKREPIWGTEPLPK